MTAETKPSPAPDPEEPPKTSRIPRWVGATAALALTVGIVAVILFYGYQARPGWVGVADKQFWDYLELLIVPAALAIGVYLLNRAQQGREREAQAAQKERELEISDQRAQDEALQAYLNKMSEFLIDKKLHKKSHAYDPVRVTARAQTLAVLRGLDADRKRTVLLFLREAQLIYRNNRLDPTTTTEPEVLFYAHYVGLENADLSKANLKGARLISTSGKDSISLRGANLKDANLSRADLREADLSKAFLIEAKLAGAVLNDADLSGANLYSAVLNGANLYGANLNEVNLRGVKGWTEVQSSEAWSLEGATMPNGQKYEDWFKDLEARGEDGENSGLS